MIPSVFPEIQYERSAMPSKDHCMNIKEKSISGYADELESMKQVIFKILNTERYRYIMYSWNYGIELSDLYGEPYSYVCPVLEQRITEALTQDERVNSVDNFEFESVKKGTVRVSFTVHTIFGDLQAEKEFVF